jgi:hypothetical protein
MNHIAINEKEGLNDCIDYIVVCASGKGTRLLPITQRIPKLLVNVDHSNILAKIVDYWKKYSKKFVIVIDSKYNTLVDFYLKIYNIEYEIINVDCKHGEENSYTLHMALKDEKFTHKKVLITWCDIFPETIIPSETFNNQNIIFTYKHLGRYNAFNNKIIKKPNGNIIGIYYFHEFKQIIHFEPKMDICDCYKQNFSEFDTYEIESLIDVGDYSKLYEHTSNLVNRYNTRYFNKVVELPDNIIEKRSTCDYGDKIIKHEMNFYKYHCLDNIPDILEFGEDFFKMKKIINSDSLITVFNNLQITEQMKLLKSTIIELEKIHNVETMNTCNVLQDIKLEFSDKVLQRIHNIEVLLSYFHEIKMVNKIPIKYTHEFIINDIYNKIKHFYTQNDVIYHTIHGDPHLSNILIDDYHKIWFIDPRGYFGNTSLFGLKEYDISKILYSLSGFDEINNNNNHFFIIDETDNIYVNVNNNMDAYLDIFDKYDKTILIGMTILHWFGLTDYSKNNIHKCISSYYYGIYLYHYYFL